MRILIDGYNLMYARGLMEPRLAPERFRKLRRRFLNDLAGALDPVDAHQTTVVFDASAPPDDLPAETTFKGLLVEFAVSDENADARIEWLIAHHPAPKSLTVVSSDHRIRQAAARRKAQALTAEEFLDQLESRAKREHAESPPAPSAEDLARMHGLSRREAEFWEEAFSDLADDPATHESLGKSTTDLTDEEIARIEREVERESQGPR
jgi:uncharacterized protein